MQLQITIGYKEIVELVRQLPKSQLKDLTKTIERELLASQNISSEPNTLQKLLLEAPTWSEKEYADYMEVRERINQFRAL